jgi:hypothetical protein
MAKALVVYETVYGNTRRIARAIAVGLAGHCTVELVAAADARADIPDDVDLVVVGGPTHAFSMSRPATREEASQRAGGHVSVRRGIREWLESLPEGDHRQRFAGFDTRMDMPLLTGAASRSATRMAKHHGFAVLKPESFVVETFEGPLQRGEVERAREWGAGLGAALVES